MSPDELQDSLDLSAKLEKQAAHDTTARWKKAFIDCHTFGSFKEAAFGEALGQTLGKGLGWGAGLSIPALMATWLATSHAGQEARNTVHDARNQMLLLGGAKAMGDIAGKVMGPNRMETVEQETYPSGEGDALRRKVTKFSSDQADTYVKLAAVIELDNLFEAQLAKVSGVEKTAVEECFLMNRERGVDFLREILGQ